MTFGRIAALAVVVALPAAFVLPERGFGHGDVTPQPVDTKGLEPLDEWLTENPYRGNETAIKIGASAYAGNCARCHGLQAISGGLAPDLRFLPTDASGDEWYINRVRNGLTQGGATRMPAFEGILNQEAMWAIRSYVDSLPEE